MYLLLSWSPELKRDNNALERYRYALPSQLVVCMILLTRIGRFRKLNVLTLSLKRIYNMPTPIWFTINHTTAVFYDIGALNINSCYRNDRIIHIMQCKKHNLGLSTSTANLLQRNQLYTRWHNITGDCLLVQGLYCHQKNVQSEHQDMIKANYCCTKENWEAKESSPEAHQRAIYGILTWYHYIPHIADDQRDNFWTKNM